MRIFYPLLCYYPSEAGGPANTIYWMNKSLGRIGYSSYIISTKYGLKEIVKNNDEVYNNFNINVNFVDNSLLDFFKKNKIDQFKNCDIIHLSSLFFLPTLPLIIFFLFIKKKIILSPRGELYSSAIGRKNFFKRIYLYLIKVVQHKIVFHSTNNFESALINKYFPKAKDLVEVPNYIDLPKKVYCPKKEQILFLGRINPIKNIDLLIKAFSQLDSNIKEKFVLIIAGEAKLDYEKLYLKELKQLVKDLNLNRVSFVGGVFKNEKEVLLAESYCLVLPSKSENFGNVVLESLAQSTPAIVSTGASSWSLLEQNKIGYWIEPNVREISNSLEKILTMDITSYRTMCDNSRKVASELFDIDQNIHVWKNIYENL